MSRKEDFRVELERPVEQCITCDSFATCQERGILRVTNRNCSYELLATLPFGIETEKRNEGTSIRNIRLNGLWSPFGIETGTHELVRRHFHGLNGLWSPFGIETYQRSAFRRASLAAKWPVEPVRD